MHHSEDDNYHKFVINGDTLHQQMRENHELLEAVKCLNDFCDKDERQPYFDIKKHRHGKVYLTIRTQNWPQEAYKRPQYARAARKSKKFFGLTRASVMIDAARYVKSGQF